MGAGEYGVLVTNPDVLLHAGSMTTSVRRVVTQERAEVRPACRALPSGCNQRCCWPDAS